MNRHRVKMKLGPEWVEIDNIEKVITAVWLCEEAENNAQWVTVSFDWVRVLPTGLEMLFTRALELLTIDVNNCVIYVENNFTAKNCTITNISSTRQNIENHLKQQ
jgi:hypothetical protein